MELIPTSETKMQLVLTSDISSQWRCSICDYVALSKDKLALHEHTHELEKQGETVYKCILCNYRTINQRYMIVHERTHSGEKPYQCQDCGKSFGEKNRLKTHERLVHKGEKRYKCEQCDFSTASYTSLKTHQKAHLKCQHCSFAATKRADLIVHEHMHKLEESGKDVFSCSKCEFKTLNEEAMEAHKKTHNTKARKRYECKVCLRLFSDMVIFDAHTLIHEGTERPCKCDQCDAAYEEADVLAKHKQRIHRKLWGCDICGKSFNRSAKLEIHRSVHTREKRYQCNVCEYRCNDPSNLDRHKRTNHSQIENTLICDICELRFRDTDDLERHILESGPLVYSCDKCKFQSHFEVGLSRHEKIHKMPLAITDGTEPFDIKGGNMKIKRKPRKPPPRKRPAPKKFKAVSDVTYKNREKISKKEIQRNQKPKKQTNELFLEPLDYSSQSEDCDDFFPIKLEPYFSSDLHNDYDFVFHGETDHMNGQPGQSDQQYESHYEDYDPVEDLENSCENMQDIPAEITRGIKYENLDDDVSHIPCICKQCPKQFLNRSQLERHSRIHKIPILFKCRSCKKQFVTLSKLYMHTSFHCSVPSLRCPICKLLFVSNRQWKLHMKESHRRRT